MLATETWRANRQSLNSMRPVLLLVCALLTGCDASDQSVRGKNDAFKPLNRHIRLEGQANFRDLGGYQTSDGRTVKWRELFRAGEPQPIRWQTTVYSCRKASIGTIRMERRAGIREAQSPTLPKSKRTAE